MQQSDEAQDKQLSQIKDKNGIEKFKIWGKYSDKIYLQNSLTG